MQSQTGIPMHMDVYFLFYDTEPAHGNFFQKIGEIFVNFLRLFAKRRFENSKNDSQRRCDHFCQKIIEIGAILAIFRPFEISVWSEKKIWTPIFWFQETGVLEELRGFERHWHVRRKKLLPVVRLFLGRLPWRRGKQVGLCFWSGPGTQNDFNHLVF